MNLYTFIDEESFIKIREPKIPDPTRGDTKEESHNLIEYEHIPNSDWSTEFSVKDFEDFQIAIKSQHEEELGSAMREVTEIDRNTGEEALIKQKTKVAKWHEP